MTCDSSVTQTTTHANVVKALTCFRRHSCHRLGISPHHNSLCSWGHPYSSGQCICIVCCNVTHDKLLVKSIRIYDTNSHPSHTILSFRHQQNPTNQYFVFTGFPSDFLQQSPPSYWQPQLLQGMTCDSSVTQTTTHANVVKALTCFRRHSCHRLCISPHHNPLCS